MRIRELLKEKVESLLLQDFVIKLAQEMTELKRENYHALLEVDSTLLEVNKRKDKITSIENTLNELEIPFKTDWSPDDDFDYGDDD